MSPISTHFIYNEKIFSRAFKFVDFSLKFFLFLLYCISGYIFMSLKHFKVCSVPVLIL